MILLTLKANKRLGVWAFNKLENKTKMESIQKVDEKKVKINI